MAEAKQPPQEIENSVLESDVAPVYAQLRRLSLSNALVAGLTLLAVVWGGRAGVDGRPGVHHHQRPIAHDVRERRLVEWERRVGVQDRDHVGELSKDVRSERLSRAHRGQPVPAGRCRSRHRVRTASRAPDRLGAAACRRRALTFGLLGPARPGFSRASAPRARLRAATTPERS